MHSRTTTRSRSPGPCAKRRSGPPSALGNRRLRGDVDNIVLKAMQKEPARRYASVEQLSEDIRRHLEGLPIAARPDTSIYRAVKFVRRHRLGVVSAAAVVAALGRRPGCFPSPGPHRAAALRPGPRTGEYLSVPVLRPGDAAPRIHRGPRLHRRYRAQIPRWPVAGSR